MATEDDRELLALYAPGFTAAEVMERVNAAWRFLDGRFPVPREVPECPACRQSKPQLQRISFGRHDGTIPGRADVTIKCTVCSHLWAYGVPVPDEIWAAAVEDGRRSWEWRQIKDAIA
jgi:hypothetical protein